MQSLFFCSKTGEKEGGCTFYKFLTAHLTISCPWDSEGKSYNDRDTEVFPSDLMEVKDMDDRQRSGNSEKKAMVMAESHKYLKLVKTPSRHIAGGMALEEWQPIWHHLRGKGSIVRAAKVCWS